MFRVIDLTAGRVELSSADERVAPPPEGTLQWIDLLAQDGPQLGLLRAGFDFHPLACMVHAQALALAGARALAATRAGLTVAFVVAGIAPAWAQQPFLVDDAAATAARVWHLEVSNQAEVLRRMARPVLWQDALDVEVVYGVADRLEVAALVPAVGLFTSSHTTVGIGDSSFGAKYRLTRTANAPHQVALSGSLELPTGSARRQLGSGLVDYGLTLITQHRVSGAGTVRTNVGAVLVGNTQTGLVGVKTRGGVLVTGISYVRSLSSRVQAGGEFVTFVSARNVGSSIINWQLGGNVALGRATTLDLGVLGGWLAASPRIGVQLGLSIDLNRAAAP